MGLSVAAIREKGLFGKGAPGAGSRDSPSLGSRPRVRCVALLFLSSPECARRRSSDWVCGYPPPKETSSTNHLAATRGRGVVVCDENPCWADSPWFWRPAGRTRESQSHALKPGGAWQLGRSSVFQKEYDVNVSRYLGQTRRSTGATVAFSATIHCAYKDYLRLRLPLQCDEGH
jgi:hypothetical protein